MLQEEIPTITPGRVAYSFAPRFVTRRHIGGKYGVWDTWVNTWATLLPYHTTNVSRRSAQVVANTLNAQTGA